MKPWLIVLITALLLFLVELAVAIHDAPNISSDPPLNVLYMTYDVSSFIRAHPGEKELNTLQIYGQINNLNPIETGKIVILIQVFDKDNNTLIEDIIFVTDSLASQEGAEFSRLYTRSDNISEGTRLKTCVLVYDNQGNLLTCEEDYKQYKINKKALDVNR